MTLKLKQKKHKFMNNDQVLTVWIVNQKKTTMNILNTKIIEKMIAGIQSGPVTSRRRSAGPSTATPTTASSTSTSARPSRVASNTTATNTSFSGTATCRWWPPSAAAASAVSSLTTPEPRRPWAPPRPYRRITPPWCGSPLRLRWFFWYSR